MDFGHQVDQKLGLRGVVRGVLVYAKKTHHAVDQIVEGGAEVGCAVVILIARPAIEAEAVVLVFFQRRGVEDAHDIFADVFTDLDRFDVVARFTGGEPVEGVNVQQNDEHAFVGKLLLEQGGHMLRREMRLTEQRNDERVRMAAAKFGNLVGGMAVAGSDLAQVFARHAIKPVDGGAVVAGGGEQFVKWSPFVSPVEFETDALAQLAFVDFAPEPFVENMLVAGKNSFDSQHYGAPVEFEIAQERSQIALRIGQGVIVADQNDSRFRDFAPDTIGV